MARNSNTGCQRRNDTKQIQESSLSAYWKWKEKLHAASSLHCQHPTTEQLTAHRLPYGVVVTYRIREYL